MGVLERIAKIVEANINALISSAEDPEKKFQEKVQEYEDLFYTPYLAAARGYISSIIRPRESRPRLIEAFDMLKNKREIRPARKHGNIPM